jgi:ankyrin repeat protein
MLRLWSQHGVKVRTGDPLCASVFNKKGVSFDVLSCLVKELGADVNQRDEYGQTALTSAVCLGKHDTVRFVVEELGADVDTGNNSGNTPLHLAILIHASLSMVRILIKNGSC